MNLSSRTLTLITVVAVVAIFALILVYRSQTPAAAQLATTDVDFQLDRQPVLGDPDAPVTIVSFEDFKCPSCKSFEDNAFPQIRDQLVETGRANLAFINFQFLAPDSVTAGIAAECAYSQDPDLFWEYKSAIFRAQGPQNQAWATPDLLVQLARESVPDLDAEQLEQCIVNRETEDEVVLDRQIAQASGATGTPTVFVNGAKLPNWQFSTIEQAVAQAEANAN